MITLSEQNVDELRCEFADKLARMGPIERQGQVREFLESIADWSQGTLEEEIYLRALRAMRKR